MRKPQVQMVSLRREIYEPEHPVIAAHGDELNDDFPEPQPTVLVLAQGNKENSFEISFTAKNARQKKLFAKRSRDISLISRAMLKLSQLGGDQECDRKINNEQFLQCFPPTLINWPE